MLRRTAFLLAAALCAGAATLPRQAPDFTVNMPNGKNVPLSSYKGMPVVLALILTTCSHCQHTTGILSKLQQEYGARGLQVIESAIEVGGAAFVPRFIQQFNPPFPVGYNTNDEAQAFMQHSPMLLLHMPGVLFIDRTGKIVAQYEGDDPDMTGDQEKNLRRHIEEILKPPAGTTAKAPAKKAPAKK
jgi:cytochrome oxidase Cu insertion factor (SCO1/SenC/PrrC family)